MEPSTHDCTQLNPRQRRCELYIPALLTGVTYWKYLKKTTPQKLSAAQDEVPCDLLAARGFYDSGFVVKIYVHHISALFVCSVPVITFKWAITEIMFEDQSVKLY